MTETIESLLSKHVFSTGMDPQHLSFIAGCGANVRYNAGQYVFKEGEPADHFFLIRHGRLSLEIFVPERGPLVIETLSEGDVLGWSWLFPPYRWVFDARALEVVRAISLDGACIRAKCEEDARLGYELMKRFSQMIMERLQATRLRLLDMYGRGPSA